MPTIDFRLPCERGLSLRQLRERINAYYDGNWPPQEGDDASRFTDDFGAGGGDLVPPLQAADSGDEGAAVSGDEDKGEPVQVGLGL